jgi:hypothetical protein
MEDLGAIGKAVDISLAASRGKIKDPTGGALHYYAHHKAKPYWSRHGYKLLIGEHTFISGLSDRAWPQCDREGTEGRASPEAKGGRAGHIKRFVVTPATAC